MNIPAAFHKAGQVVENDIVSLSHDLTELADQFNNYQQATNRKIAELEQRLDDYEGIDPPPVVEPEPPDIGTPPSDSTEYGINVSHYRFTHHVQVDPSRNTGYRVSDEFVALHGQYPFIRVMNHTAQMSARDRNRNWSSRITAADAVKWDDVGLPIEALIEVANACNSDIWWNLPQQCDEPFMEAAGLMFKSMLNPGLTVHLEGANEWWDQKRGWLYYQQAAGDFARVAYLYARDSVQKFAAFNQQFDIDRTVRILGGQLHNLGVLKAHVLKHVDDWEYDAITCSGYFGNSYHLGHDWRDGKHGLTQSKADFNAHEDLATEKGKSLCVYELNHHILQNEQVARSAEVAGGVEEMARYALNHSDGPVCLYSGVGNWFANAPFPLYDTNYQPIGYVADKLNLPTI